LRLLRENQIDLNVVKVCGLVIAFNKNQGSSDRRMLIELRRALGQWTRLEAARPVVIPQFCRSRRSGRTSQNTGEVADHLDDRLVLRTAIPDTLQRQATASLTT